MTSLLAGTVAHGARGGRGVSTSHYRRISPGLSGTPRYSPELPGNGSHNTIHALPISCEQFEFGIQRDNKILHAFCAIVCDSICSRVADSLPTSVVC